MTEQELRELVRDAVLRHTGRETLAPAEPARVPPHPSHALLPLTRGGDDDGACVIEPSVPCTHCGYCVSYGH
jgi:hypothetical protein